MEEKSLVSIYKLNDEISLEEFDQFLLDKGYLRQELEVNALNGYEFDVYYLKKSTPANPDWKKLLKDIVKSEQDILKNPITPKEGFVWLVKSPRGGAFIVVGGLLGYSSIQKFISDNFGIDVFSRLIKKEDKIIRAAKEKSVMGNILGLTKHFRSNNTLFENDAFGSIYQELQASMDKQMLATKFGFLPSDFKREAVCIAKASFQIRKKVTVDQVVRIIKGCEEVLLEREVVVINNVQRIFKKRNESLFASLENELFEQLWDKYSQTASAYSFDLCHSNFEKYLTASEYVLTKGLSERSYLEGDELEELRDVKVLFDIIKNKPEAPSGKNEFIDLIKNLKIFAYDENEIELTQGRFMDHLFGDVSFESGKYFFIDGNWYRIRDSFIEDLNESCAYFISAHYCDSPNRRWNYPHDEENAYNQQFIGDENTLVLDQVLPDYIEPCDVMKWDDSNLYLYHVKASFGNSMRDLCSQIFIAAKRITQDARTEGKPFIRKIYSTLKNKIGGATYFDAVGKQTERITEQEFVNLFNKKIVFVLSVLDVNESQRDIRNVQEFRSNIAKFSIQLLVRNMKGIDAELGIAQIMKAGQGHLAAV